MNNPFGTSAEMLTDDILTAVADDRSSILLGAVLREIQSSHAVGQSTTPEEDGVQKQRGPDHLGRSLVK